MKLNKYEYKLRTKEGKEVHACVRGAHAYQALCFAGHDVEGADLFSLPENMETVTDVEIREITDDTRNMIQETLDTEELTPLLRESVRCNTNPGRFPNGKAYSQHMEQLSSQKSVLISKFYNLLIKHVKTY